MSAINFDNKNYESGKYPLFLGEDLGLYDTINITYNSIEKNYLKQRAQMWAETEVSLDQSRKDFATCSENNYNVMIKNLSYQWSADSLAKSIIALFSPFISNNELAGGFMFQSAMEIIHSRTYSEIIRQCIKDPQEIFTEIRANSNIFDRMETVEKAFSELKKAGHEYSLGMIEVSDHLRLIILKGVFALLALEGIQFMSSFSATFAMGEQQLFVGACKLISKIMLDEILHSQLDLDIIESLLKEPEWKRVYDNNSGELKAILDEVVKSEEQWADYLFSEGRVVLGLNAPLMKEWLWHNASPIYRRLKLPYDFPATSKNPLPWMDKWMNPDKVQTANMEIQKTEYKLNVSSTDIDEEFDF